MKKLIGKKWLLLTAVATFLLSGCAEQKAQDISNDVTGNFTQTISNDQRIPAEFVRHVDGDTTVLRIDGKEQKVRFLLIDTPETVKPNTKVQPYGLEASKRTKELLSTASEITFEYDKGDKTDRYGRSLGYIFVDGTLLQKTLVGEGLARVAYVKEPNTKYLEELKKAQEQAKSQLIGIWIIPGYVTERGFQP
ncbi:thermonuclease family protein [Enterococcus faecalis]|uniref:thermonuclease family protein n=1 Tax=Enterococcus faecalis TaxID=1351 RepID=UPI00032DBD57|nr:thermonuclease family protein [Enterococcus faecalis]EOI16914.1 thermonuclease [Enterococcus faecalis EnGen0244]KAJ72125.1 Phage-encoded chromosome degrading nuclease YokF [Enterococcus faecalis AZ19]MBP4106725.1 thermonuclease family protein [Enterococcus faecalis]MDK6785543.1 thermonuclease family protein [Enterococcus faecalis]MDK7811221.1 thermonuclease family protein [Enterococcus faecalis]